MLLSRTTVLVLVVIVVFLSRGVWGVYQKNRDAEEKLAQAQREYNTLQEQQAFLEEDNARLHTEEGIEEEIRDTFGLGKEGERVIIVVAADTDSATSSSEEQSWWKRFKTLFTRN